jgi:hypothetical protein
VGIPISGHPSHVKEYHAIFVFLVISFFCFDSRREHSSGLTAYFHLDAERDIAIARADKAEQAIKCLLVILQNVRGGRSMYHKDSVYIERLK